MNSFLFALEFTLLISQKMRLRAGCFFAEAQTKNHTKSCESMGESFLLRYSYCPCSPPMCVFICFFWLWYIHIASSFPKKDGRGESHPGALQLVTLVFCDNTLVTSCSAGPSTLPSFLQRGLGFASAAGWPSLWFLLHSMKVAADTLFAEGSNTPGHRL